MDKKLAQQLKVNFRKKVFDMLEMISTRDEQLDYQNEGSIASVSAELLKKQYWFYEITLLLFFTYFTFRLYSIISIVYAPVGCFNQWWVNPYDSFNSPIILFGLLGLLIAVLFVLLVWVHRPKLKSWRTAFVVFFAVVLIDFFGANYLVWKYAQHDAGFITKEEFRSTIGMDPNAKLPIYRTTEQPRQCK